MIYNFGKKNKTTGIIHYNLERCGVLSIASVSNCKVFSLYSKSNLSNYEPNLQKHTLTYTKCTINYIAWCIK